MNLYDDSDFLPASFPCGHSCCHGHIKNLNLRCHICESPITVEIFPSLTLRDCSLVYKNLLQQLEEAKLNSNIIPIATQSTTYAELIVEAIPEAMEQSKFYESAGHTILSSTHIVEQAFDEKLSIVSHHLTSLFARPDGSISFYRSSVHDSDQWIRERLGPNKYAFKSMHGKYLCAEPHGHILANREIAQEWETFTIGTIIQLKSYHNKFVCITPGTCRYIYLH
jgi:hypothetical protein